MSQPHTMGTAFTRAMGAVFSANQGVVTVQVTASPIMEGPRGYAHGGALAALLDEAMGAASWLAGYQCLTVHLEYDFRRPVPLGTAFTVRAWVERGEARKVFARGEAILPDGAVAVESSGIFALAPPGFFASGMGLVEPLRAPADKDEA
jgi:acyl-coenzyme A thioesterase PaaI-like protein